MREHGQGDVPVPGAVLADLVVVQAGLVLGLGEAVLDSPPGARYGDELGQGDRAGRLAAEERQLKLAFLARAQGPADQQPVPGAAGADQRPVVQPRPLGPVGAAQPLPPARGTRAASSSARRAARRRQRSCRCRPPPSRSGICCSSSHARSPGLPP